jgi:hypothetical protein
MKRHFRAVILAAASAAAPLGAAAEGDLGVSLGAEYTTGDYGTGADTTIWYFPFTFRYEAKDITLSVTVPYLIVEGPGNVIPAIGDAPRHMSPGMGAMQVVRPGPVGPVRRESGLGDVVLSGSLRLVAETPARPRVDLTGKIKLATADEAKNLGTGENDYAVQVDLEKGSFFGYLGYRVYGDPPGIDLDNAVYGLVGLSQPLAADTRAGVALYAQQAAAAAGVDDQLELGVFLSRRLGKDGRLRPYVVFGLSDGSPDWGVGVTITLYR